MDNFEDLIPVSPWADPMTEALVNADPSTDLFREIVAFAIRAEFDKPTRTVASADVASVMDECGVTEHELADTIGAPVSYLYAVRRGWHRLGLRGLAVVAEALEVPLARFFVDPDDRFRPDVQRYAAYRIVAPRVTILGGG